MNKKRYFFVILILINIVFQISNIFGEEQNEDLDKLYSKKLAYKKEVYKKTLEFLKENPDAPNAAKLYFNLAEMSTEIDVNKPEITAYYYKMVLKKDPNFPSKDVVLYNLAYFSYDAAKRKINKAKIEAKKKDKSIALNWPDSLRLNENIPEVKKAIQAYNILINYYPDSPYHSEAIYRLGLIYFDIALDSRNPMKYYEKAKKYFNILANKVGDKLRAGAIFQRGWIYFISGKYSKAIEDFTTILQYIKKDSLSKIKVYFEKDAIENIAYSLVGFDGTNFTGYSAAAKKLKEIFSNFVSEEYAKKIILNAVKIKLSYYAPMQAVDIYNSLIALYPTDIDNPCYNDSIISIYKRYPKLTRNNEDPKKLIVKEYIRITKDYSYDSKWFEANKDKDISKQLKIILYAYNFVEKRYYNEFAKNQNEENYKKYVDLVDKYIKLAEYAGENLKDKYKLVSQRLIEASLSLASKTSKPHYYFDAISRIKSYIRNYNHDEKYFEYNRNLFLVTEKLYESLKDSVKISAFIDTTINIVLDSLKLDSLLIDASITYEKVLNDTLNTINEKEKNKELARIILLRANLYKKNAEYDLAIEDYKKILSLKDLPKNLKREVLSTLAYIYQMKGEYTEAENYYRQAALLSSKKQRIMFENNILATIKSSAEAKLKIGDYEKSAQEFLRLAKELKQKDSRQSIAYTIKAIEVYKKAKEYQKAIDLYVKIADEAKDKIGVLAALKGAWTISDSLLNDLNQTIELKQKFIKKYPSSNEAYLLRLQLIRLYDEGPLADKEKAAQMYLSLFDDAYNKKIDIGEDKVEDIFLNALRIYEELNNDKKLIELTYRFVKLFPKNPIDEKLLTKVAIVLDKNSDVEGMLDFEKRYPHHPSAVDLLKRVAFIYKSRGEENKYEDLARYIHKKYPSIDLLTEIAAKKLKQLKTEIDSLFNEKNYELMNAKIAEFKKIDENYKKDNIKLNLAPVYKRFEYYKNYIAFHKKYSDFLSKIDAQILNKTPNQLIKVNNLTTWKRHLNGGRKRIKSLINKCISYEKKFRDLIDEGKKYQITDEEVLKGLLKIAKMYDYAGKVIIKQIDKYVNVSNELNNEFFKSNPLLQKQTKERVRLLAKQISIKLIAKAVKYYGNIYTLYKTQKNIVNDITQYAEKRLKDLGYLKEKEYEYFYSDPSLIVNKTKINDYNIDKKIDSLWINVNILGDKIFEGKADVIKLSQFIKSYLSKKLHFDIEPELIEIIYLHNQPIKIYINGIKSTLEPVVKDTLEISGNNVKVYSQKVIKGLNAGDNDLLLVVPADESENLFAFKIVVQYDKEKLELYRTTKTEILVTDYTWSSKKRVENIAKINNLSDWSFVSKGYLQYFKPQLYGLEKSKAKVIWSNDLDTMNVQTRYFAKEIYIPGKVIKASSSVAAQEISSMYVNGKEVYKDKKLLFDKSLKQALPLTVQVPLKKGKNIIIIKVKGGKHYKGLLAEFSYTYKKPENEMKKEENKEKIKNITQEEKVSIDTLNSKKQEVKQDTLIDRKKANIDSNSKLDKNINKAVPDTLKNKNFENRIVSDYSWFTLKGDFNYIISEDDSLWTLVGKPYHAVVDKIIKDFEEEGAKQIWYPESTKNDSSDIYFLKSFENNKEAGNGVLKVYSSYPVSIWLNNEKVADMVDDTKKEINIKIKNLNKGKNTLFIRIHKNGKIKSGEFFIFELKY